MPTAKAHLHGLCIRQGPEPIIQINGPDTLWRWDFYGGLDCMSSVKSESKSADDEWAGLIQKALEHARNFDWGLYTNTQLDMANLLHREGRHRYELELLFWVLYLDINGPENQSGCDAVLLKEFPPFDPSSAMIAPVIAERAESLISMLELDTGTVRTLFLDCATKRRNKLMPISPDNAWNELQNHNAKLQRRNEL